MTTKLIETIPDNFSSASNINDLFSIQEKLRIEKFKGLEECSEKSCEVNLFFGFFFDGTKNNYIDAEKGNNHSNVVRLYDCYPGQSTPGVLPSSSDWKTKKDSYKNFFKVYVPGVATAFKAVGDSGQGMEQTQGAASGYRGEARIIWAMIQAINNIHFYFLKSMLISPEEAKSFIGRVILNRDRKELMKPRSSFEPKYSTDKENEKTRLEFEKILTRLHAAINMHWPGKNGKPKVTKPAIVKKIYLSTFGFSRGATQARAFVNWLITVCALDARLCQKDGRLTLGGFEVEFNFLGLFDTVASVGLGNTLGNSFMGKFFDGHGAWADTDDSLRIPTGLRCVHLVAAHEIRRSFPLDSISVKHILGPRCDEIVVPGVHSDLGCGYAPGEQGRGTDRSGADMLARIPLIYMYREARLAGVPLKLEFASDIAKDRFILLPRVINALNAYLATCKVKTGTLTAIMREQGKQHILWHKARRHSGSTPVESTASFLRASNFDKNDLASANEEFELEIAEFNKWLDKKGKGYSPTSQSPGFDNSHENEWEEIATWWRTAPAPPPEVLNFFDDYVHDSRAWFKLIPKNPDNETDMIKQLSEKSEARKKRHALNVMEKKICEENNRISLRTYGKSMAVLQVYQPVEEISEKDRAAVDEFDRTGKIPRMKTTGREPFDSTWDSWGLSGKAGYLRFRKIYSGYDSVLISSITDDNENRAVA